MPNIVSIDDLAESDAGTPAGLMVSESLVLIQWKYKALQYDCRKTVSSSEWDFHYC